MALRFPPTTQPIPRSRHGLRQTQYCSVPAVSIRAMSETAYASRPGDDPLRPSEAFSLEAYIQREIQAMEAQGRTMARWLDQIDELRRQGVLPKPDSNDIVAVIHEARAERMARIEEWGTSWTRPRLGFCYRDVRPSSASQLNALFRRVPTGRRPPLGRPRRVGRHRRAGTPQRGPPPWTRTSRSIPRSSLALMPAARAAHHGPPPRPVARPPDLRRSGHRATSSG